MTHATHKTYRFADFTLEASEHRLSQRGQEMWIPARFYLFTGKFEAALKELEASLAAALKQTNSNLTPWSQLELGLTHWELGNTEAFGRMMKSAAAESVGLPRVEALGWLGVYKARARRADEARRLRDELTQERREQPISIAQPRIEGELDHKVLTITVPAASAIWVQTLSRVSKTLEKKGEAEKATTYREQYRRLWPEEAQRFITITLPED